MSAALITHRSLLITLFVFYDNYLFVLIVLLEHYLDDLGVSGLHLLTHVVGLNRQLAVAAIDQHRKLDSSRASEIDEFVQRRANGAARVQHIVNKHNRTVGDINGYVGLIDYRARSDGREIIAIKCDVQLAGRRTSALELFDLVSNSFGERHTSAANADQQQVPTADVALDDL